jgi:rhamnosyltransferase subunit B
LLVTPYREHLPAVLPDYACHVPYAPFSALLPRCAAIVHHGGIGTCAQGFASGIPQVLMPMGFDQPDNALRVTRLGVGAVVLPSQFTGAAVDTALAKVLSSKEVAGACRRYQERIRSADAIRRACDLIEEAAN